MADYADLEIGLDHRWDGDNCTVALRFSQPGSESDTAPPPGQARFDLETLRAQEGTESYGRTLTDNLFTDPKVREAFGAVRAASAQTPGRQLRIRLLIGQSAPELHNLRWETLRDPDQVMASLLTNENIPFSRYLSSRDWRPVSLRPKGDLRALVVIANPDDLAQYKPGGRHLTPVDVPGELDRARRALDSIGITFLASVGAATPNKLTVPTLNNLMTHLRDGYDILYLVCHGAIIDGEPRLWLEDELGHACVVAGSELLAELGELIDRPRLVVLASCKSAGSGEAGEEATAADGSALTALGPRLAEAGIPAVLAMQGEVTMTTVAEFMPVFFQELQQHGQIDRAMAVARGRVRERPDYWMPVLFMRLKSGSIWYVPGFEGDRPDHQDFRKWPALKNNIDLRRCTPILGSGLLEALIGSTRDLAQKWADSYDFPMAHEEREDLPQVAQYLAVVQQFDIPNIELANYVRMELLKRFGDKLPPGSRDATIEQLLTAVGKLLREENKAEPHKLLARLPFPIYITANPDNLLFEALVKEGKNPRRELCRWKREQDFPPELDFHWPSSVYDPDSPIYDPNYKPTSEAPLVYHLFGHVSQLDSVVLKEDDYFDYLAGVTRNKKSIPEDVRKALADTALLFLGFRLEDWNFRVLFRSLRQDGRTAGRVARIIANVAAQISPEEGRNLDPEGARHYLQGYFQEARVNIYWGSVDDFVKDLQSQVKDLQPKWDSERPKSLPAPVRYPDVDERKEGGAA